jgi:hypothetical protein
VTDVFFTEAELEAIETLASFVPSPGTRCPTCHRRVNKPRKEDSPVVKEVRFRGPTDLVEAAEEGLDALQEYVGIDPYSYPRIKLLEALLALGASQREQLRAFFESGDETIYGEGN